MIKIKKISHSCVCGAWVGDGSGEVLVGAVTVGFEETVLGLHNESSREEFVINLLIVVATQALSLKGTVK